MTATPALPTACAVAFKEWAGVCDALANGQQSVILRKGGIAEGPNGFAPEHPMFWLYPTHLHEAQQGLRDGWGARPAPESPPDAVPLRTLAAVASMHFVDRAELLPALAPLHVWTADTILKRFAYRRPGLWVLGVRVYSRPDAELVATTAEHAGCKTWVSLAPALSTRGLAPVLDESEAETRRARLTAALAAKP